MNVPRDRCSCAHTCSGRAWGIRRAVCLAAALHVGDIALPGRSPLTSDAPRSRAAARGAAGSGRVPGERARAGLRICFAGDCAARAPPPNSMASSRALRGAAHINNNRSRDARKTGPACAERQPARSREPCASLRLCHGAGGCTDEHGWAARQRHPARLRVLLKQRRAHGLQSQEPKLHSHVTRDPA